MNKQLLLDALRANLKAIEFEGIGINPLGNMTFEQESELWLKREEAKIATLRQIIRLEQEIKEDEIQKSSD